MKHTRQLRQIKEGLSVRRCVVLIAVSLAAIMVVFSVTGCAKVKRVEKAELYKIRLKSRTFTPTKGIAADFRKTMVGPLERGEKRHVYVQLKKHLDQDERAQLEKQGVKLLNYIGSYTWHASISDPKVLEFTSSAVVRRRPIIGSVLWIGRIESMDKIEPKIREKGVGDYNRQPDGRVDIVVVFFPDVSKDTLNAIAKSYGQTIQKPGMLNDIILRLSETQISRLGQEDAVQWVEEVGPPDTTFNDGSRACINIDVLQAAPYSLDGTNVDVGEWDGGEIDDSHDDLAGRVTVVETEGISAHATHVAGTLGGDGTRSAAEGGTANQWRGMAIEVDFFSYCFLTDDLEPEEHDDAITINGIDLSQNSWGRTGNFGDYRSRSSKYDNIVRGTYGRAIPVIFAAGNEGDGFITVTPPGGTAKNTIVVGNVFSDTSEISATSSRGPTDNDQIKPDVVAAGDESGVARINSTVSTDTYAEESGTSMAAPAVSGTIALMLQQYRESYFGVDTSDEAPLPSTFKAILAHTAEDLIDNPGGGADLVGPDYVYGYGLVNAQAAVDAIRNQRFLEGVILAVNDRDSYTFVVDPGDDELKVTLAWDDFPGTAGAADIIQNDLDLMLIDPAGTAFYPPWELDPANPGTPATRGSYATEALADGHRDDVNVMEQVVVDNPADGTWTIVVKESDLPEPYQRYSIIVGDQDDDRLTGEVDIMQVLDRSGSMSLSASAISTDTKIGVLRDAADQFVQMMRPNVGNQLGMVQFNHDVVPFDPTHDTDLGLLSGARATALRTLAIPSISAGGATSIGDGLREAHNQLNASTTGHDKVILLVTDGMENTDERILTVENDLINSEIAVYPLGLGHGYGIDEAKLTNLADATGGTYRVTDDPLIFRKFFIEVLAGAVDWAVIVDPVGELAQGQSVYVPVTITSDQTGASFTAYWERFDEAIDFSLISPSGSAITPSTSNSHIRFGKHERYAFYQLDFPLGGSLQGQRAGQWKMKLKGNSQIASGQTVRYSASAFAEGGSQLDVSFAKPPYLTGVSIPIRARLVKDGRPLLGARVQVYCDTPAVNITTVLHDNKVSAAELKRVRPVKSDSPSLIHSKLAIIAKRTRRNIFQRKEGKFTLYDDGKHSDGKARDGIYGNVFDKNKMPGVYSFRFVASNIPGDRGLKTTREWTASFYNGVNVELKHSDILVKRIEATPDGWRFNIRITPKDKFSNYLGPGHKVTVTLSDRLAKRQIELTDNLDGTYTKDVLLTRKQLEAAKKQRIEVDGRLFKSGRVFRQP